MNILRRTRIMLVVLGVALFLVSAPGFSADQGTGGGRNDTELRSFLAELGKQVASFRTLRTDFTQEKEMALFREPVVLKGRIFLEKPNKLAWHVDSPLRYSVLITDTMIRQWDADTGTLQELSLERNPMFRTVLEQLTVWFSGDYSALIGTNDVRILKQAPLTIEFAPREGNIARKAIKSIVITFRDDRAYLRQIRIREASGDITTITFSNTQLNVPLDKGSFEVRGNG